MGIENDNNLVAIQSWLKTQTHLPQNIGKHFGDDDDGTDDVFLYLD